MKYTKELLAPIVASSNSITDVLRRMGVSGIGGTAHGYMKRAILEFGLDISHFRSGPQISSRASKKHWSVSLVDNKRLSSTRLHKLLKESGRNYICQKCGNLGEWNGVSLVLQIDHIDGVNSNNNPSNLRYLCPNCHSQTETYCKQKIDRNHKCTCGSRRHKASGLCRGCRLKQMRKNIPSKDTLLALIWSKPSTEIAAEYGVSDSAIVKWCRFHGISKPGRGYWAKKRSQKR